MKKEEYYRRESTPPVLSSITFNKLCLSENTTVAISYATSTVLPTKRLKPRIVYC